VTERARGVRVREDSLLGVVMLGSDGGWLGQRAATRFVTLFLLYNRGFRGVGDVR